MFNQDDFHRFRRPQDSSVGLDRERVLYNSQPIVPSPSIGANPSSSPSLDSRLLLSLVKFPLGPSSNHQTDSKTQFIRESLISETALGALPGLHERVVAASEPTSRIDFSPPGSSLLLPQHTPMEHDRFQGQLSQSSDQPPTGNYPPYGSSDHMSTATSNANLTASSSSIDPSASSYSSAVGPRGRPPRLGASISNYRPMHSQHPHASSQQPALSPTSSPYYTPQQPQGQNSGGQPQQQQHYMTQPMSPTIYYPTFPHMHQQASSPSAYNVNQGYMGPVPTSAGPSMSVTTYAYPHPYPAHVSEHRLHPFAYTGPVGGISTAPLPHYPELDAQAHQQQNRSGNIDMMAGYVPVMATTGPPFAYSIPAYAPTGGSVFTPQYTGGHPYSYAPQQSQPFPAPYGQTPQGPRPPPLNLSQQQAPMQGSSSQVGLDLPPDPPSPLTFPNVNQRPPSGYSPIVASPSSGLNTPRRLDFIGRSTSGSSSFGLGLNPSGNNSFSAYGSNSAASSGETFALDRTSRAVGSTCSPIPVAVDLVGPGPDGGVVLSQEPASSQRDRERATHGIVAGGRQDRPDQQQTSTKGERSDWVMWVGNVPGDASLNELYSFFGQGPPIPEEERTAAGGDDLASAENLPQFEGAALEPRTRDEASVTGTDIGVGVGGLSGVVSVFLISRSNCAFVNYVSEASLQRGVDYFNGRPLRSPQVDPRCPKLVCRVRKKGDDIKAGVGGQRGVGTHARWVKEKQTAEIANLSPTEGDEGPKQRPPFVHGGPAGNAKKSSSGSSGSYASTTSSMLMKHFPSRYFILKSLTQHDLDLSVERGLWATQVHNQEVLDQAYRTSQNVYLIFGVNKSGEFFGYAKMDGPINQVERTPSIEWASRDSLVSPGSAKLSPSAVRGAPSQPTIQEEKERENLEQEEQQGLTLPPTDDRKSSTHASNDAATARGDENLPRAASVPLHTSGSAKHETLPYHQVSEPVRPRQTEAHEGPSYDRFAQILGSMPPRVAEVSPRFSEKPESVVSPTRRTHSFVAHLFPGTTLQDSPDPLTPGEDQKLHSLDSTTSSSARSSQPQISQTDAQDSTHSKPESERESSGFSIASAPAVMGRRYKPLSASTPIAPSETWDEVRKGTKIWPKEHSIEEEVEGAEDIIIPPSTSQSLPGEGLLAPAATGQQIQPPRLDIPPTPLAMPHLDTPDIHPAQPEFDTEQPKEEKPTSEALATVGGREEGWGTPFKVKWLRTDPLSFHRTRHLRNPWNHDREIKVSRDGTELEPGVGQRLLEEWDRTDAAPMAGRVGLPPRSPISLGGPPSPNQAFNPRGRGRGRGGMTGGWAQRDTGQ